MKRTDMYVQAAIMLRLGTVQLEEIFVANNNQLRISQDNIRPRTESWSAALFTMVTAN